MSGFLKMSAFKRFDRMRDNDTLICLINGLNSQISWENFKKLLDISPIDFFGGSVTTADDFNTLPDGLYIPSGDGVYNGVIVNNTNPAGADYVQGISFLVWNDGVLKRIDFPITISLIGKVEPGNNFAVTGGEIYRKVATLDELGIVRVSENQNVIDFITAANTSDVSVFDQGTFYHKTAGTKQPGGDFICSKNLIAIPGGIDYDYNFYLYGNAGVNFYNSAGAVVQNISTTVPATATQLSGTISLNSSVVAMGFSHYRSRPLSSVYFRAKASKVSAISKIFATVSDMNASILGAINSLKNEIGYSLSESKYKDKPFLTYDSFSKFGFQIFKSGENIFKFLQPVDVDNSEIWQPGFLRKTGVITNDTVWINTKGYYKLPTGSYSTNMVYAGNSYMWVVDKNGNMIRALQGGNNGGTAVWSFNIDNDNGEYGVKLGVSKSVVDLGWTMFFRPNQDIFISPIVESSNTGGDTAAKAIIKEVINKQNPIKRISPMITFISDDGARENAWFIEALNLYNYKATFAIITGRFPDTTPSLQAFYNKQDIVDNLLNKGHEIAGHTVSHNSSAQLATLTEDQLHQEIGKCKFDLLSVDNRIEATNFISPFGSRNTAVDRVVRQYFDANYVTRSDSDIPTGAAINYPPIDNFFMKRVSFDNPAGPGAINVSRIDIAKQAVDYVLANGGWLIFAIHPHYDQYLNPANTVDSKQELRDLLAYINGLNIPVLTAKQARTHYKNYSIGNYRLDTEYYERGINGNVSGNYL